jgi:serine/threonine-protein kinase HipA
LTQKVKPAMKFGGKYRLTEIGAYQWDKLARELKLAPEQVRASVVRLTHAVTDAAADVLRRERRRGLSHPILDRLAKAVVERAKRCALA